MGEIVILEDYKKKKEAAELKDLRLKVEEAMSAIEIYPGNYVGGYQPFDNMGYYAYDPLGYEAASLTPPLAGSMSMWDMQPSYSYEYYLDGDNDGS